MSELTATEAALLMLRGVEQGLANSAAAILEEAKAQVPVGVPDEIPKGHRPGELRDSGHIEVEDGGKVVLVVFDTPYAAKIHEQMQYKHPHGGKARFLEDPLKSMIPRLEETIASPVRKLFKTR